MPESVQLSEGDNNAGGTELVLTSPHWRLRVDWDQRLDPFEVVHLASGRVVADESYCYQLTVTGATNMLSAPVRAWSPITVRCLATPS